jgi:molybdopterin/thiamine biosynthesis adenylyltransferase/rhodanese-related sulfurtransferase
MNRFVKQEILNGFGTESQTKLRNSSILVVGAGGLGCPVLLYIAAAGVGRIGIVDGDTISLSNLNRQVLYTEGDAGKLKAVVAGQRIVEKYNDVSLTVFTEYLDTKNAFELIQQFDIIIDCCDNFSSRYVLNDACVIYSKPLIYGSIFEYEGQVSVFNTKNENGKMFNYRDLFPEPPDSKQIPDCNLNGVLGVLTGIIGIIQATEAIKLITGIGNSLAGKLLHYNLLQHQIYTIELNSNEYASSFAPKNEFEFINFKYDNSCQSLLIIDWLEAENIYLKYPENSIYIDVREINEPPKVNTINCVEMPYSCLNKEKDVVIEKTNLFVFCKSGIRSVKAANILKGIFPNKNIYSIKGGISDPFSPINRILNVNNH